MIQKPPHGANPPKDSVIDFSSNLHPDPPPARMLAAAHEGVEMSMRYPQAAAEKVRAVFSEKLDLPADQILAGPGSSSLLYLILSALRPKTVLIPIPCFSEYPYAARLSGAQVVEHPAAAPQKIPQGACVIMSNPCNPTGRILPPESLGLWLSEIQRAGGLLILDEAYGDFREHGPVTVTARTFSANPLIVLRSPLKFFTLPGLRFGIALLPAALAARVEPHIPPWPVSPPAASAALAAAEWDANEIHVRRRRVRNWADTFQKAFRTVPEIVLAPSDVHFFLIRLPQTGPDGLTLAARLSQDGMWIRTSAGMPGLTPFDIRVSTRLPEENGKLIAAFRRIYREPARVA